MSRDTITFWPKSAVDAGGYVIVTPTGFFIPSPPKPTPKDKD